ncbi:YeeE/YedE family protein [Chitinilyticum piscinae]|uniref:YeeE/YedE family protein n=1 Tax=Chitinilyticum piscinae TaxID=2866724 RepID=A0A8J7FPF6_9NEIS|nr:YeeE/YedE family protein [Chitinilyticum piscinae]MBE9609764.1 YeeE/YedE family protein [Chitinilyticum piscinae]
MLIVIALLTGLLFGFGLLLSGMVNPAKVQGFLDIAGQWDPSLAFVMGGAIGVGLVFFTLAKKRDTTLATHEPMRLPGNNSLDRRLILGSVAFGAGWGIAGICPGPALVALGAGSLQVIAFVIAMLAGMALFSLLQRKH